MAGDKKRVLSSSKRDAQRAWILAKLSEAQASGFYGELSLVMENGEIRRLVKRESILPPR